MVDFISARCKHAPKLKSEEFKEKGSRSVKIIEIALPYSESQIAAFFSFLTVMWVLAVLQYKTGANLHPVYAETSPSAQTPSEMQLIGEELISKAL